MGKTFKDTDKYKDLITKQKNITPNDWKKLQKKIRKERQENLYFYDIPFPKI